MKIFQFFVLFVLVPLLYLTTILVEIVLIQRAHTLANRWRNLASVFAGFLLSAIIILLDQNFGVHLPQAISYLNSTWKTILIFSLFGFFYMYAINILIQLGIITFVLLLQTIGLVISGYFLFMSSQREILAIAFASFVLGIILFYVIIPTRNTSNLLMRPYIETEDDAPNYSYDDHDNWR